MLSRVAENLFWIGRYIERAENMARLVDAARRMSALPQEVGRARSNEWASVLIAAGDKDTFGEAVARADNGTVIDHLIFSRTNPSSVYSCLLTARQNARAVRTALTRECWEVLNTSWTEMKDMSPDRCVGAGLSDTIDWIKGQSALFSGVFYGTMVRDDGYEFMRMGANVERVDATARILDVKYHVLLASVSEVGSAADYYQWVSVLQAAAGQRAYAFLSQDEITARGVAQFLILEDRFPRSVRFGVQRIARSVETLERLYGQRAACHDTVAQFADRLERATIDAVINEGLHEFLTDVVDTNYAVADALGRAYGFASMQAQDASDLGAPQ